MSSKRHSRRFQKNTRESEYKSVKKLRLGETVDYILWILLGGAALTHVSVSAFLVFYLLYINSGLDRVGVIVIISHILVVLSSGLYYSFHHNKQNTFWDYYGRRIPGKKLTFELMLCFAAATLSRFILLDISSIVDKGLTVQKNWFYTVPMLVILVWAAYYTVRLLRPFPTPRAPIINLEVIEARNTALKKLRGLSDAEVEELARLLHHSTSSKKVTLSLIVGFLWRSVVVAAVIQLIQTLLGGF